MRISGDSCRNVSTASGSPAITPACRATSVARVCAASGMVAIEVMSPARPRSSSSAWRTALVDRQRRQERVGMQDGCGRDHGGRQAVAQRRAGASSASEAAIARACASVVMVRFASAVLGRIVGAAVAPRLSRRDQAEAATISAVVAMLRSAMLPHRALHHRQRADRVGEVVAVADHADMRGHQRAQACFRRRRHGAVARHLERAAELAL